MADLREELWDDDTAVEEAPSQPLNGHAMSAPAVDPVQLQWARFREMFAEAMREGFWTVEDLEAKIASHRAFFFPGRTSACVGEVQVYPGGSRVMQITWAVGDVEELLTLEPGVAAVSRMMGCTGMLIEGRQAWAKLMKPLGYEPWSVTLYKVI